MSRLGITKAVLSRAIMGKEGGETLWDKMFKEKPVRVDKDFPLNIRILARVDLSDIDYQIARNYLTMPEPSCKGTIVDVGVISHGNDLVDYLARISPDNACEKDDMTMLLVETQAGKVLSTKLFTQKLEFFPPNKEEIDVWLNEADGLLGTRVLPDPEGVEFFRTWGEGEQVKPMVAREKVYTDRYGETVTTNHLIQMMYGREVHNDADQKLTDEYTLISYVNGSVIEIMIGVPVTINEGDIIGA